MANNFVQIGTAMAYINLGSEDIFSGDVVPLESKIGIAKTDIPVGDMGSVAVGGVWNLPKSSGILKQGQLVYWKEGQIVVANSDGATPSGYAWDVAAATDDMANIKID